MLNFQGIVLHETSISEEDRLWAEIWDGATVGSVQKQELEYNDNVDHSIDKSSEILNLKIFLDFMGFSKFCFSQNTGS